MKVPQLGTFTARPAAYVAGHETFHVRDAAAAAVPVSPISDQLARLWEAFPGWVIWHGEHTDSWWALPRCPADAGPGGWIEAATPVALETALRSIEAAAVPRPRRASGPAAPLAAPVPAGAGWGVRA